MAISLTEADQPSAPAPIRGLIRAGRRTGPRPSAWDIIWDISWDVVGRIARKHTGQPYPLRTNRIVLLIEADHAQAVAFG